MNKNTIPKQLITIYLVLFSLYSLATRFTLTACFMDGEINNILYRILLIAGCLLALWFLITLRKRLRTWDTGLLFLFLITLCIGIFLNRPYGLMDNIYGFFTFGFQLVLFYYLSWFLTEGEAKSILKRIVLLCSFLWDMACAGSLLQYLLGIHYVCKYASDHSAVRQGITDGRLFGLFSDPNFAAFTSLLLIYGLLYVLRNTRLRIIRIFCYGSLFVNGIYIVMSNSRTVLLSVVGSALFYVLFWSYKKGQNTYDRRLAMAGHLLRRGLCTLLGLVVVYCLILFPMQGLAWLISPERDTTAEMIREDVGTDNISNNRFAIWSAYLELYTEQPVFGFSLRSALPYAEKNNPSGYLAQTQYVTHNGYLSLLVETGIVGFVLMAVFLISLLVRAVQRSRRPEPVTDTFVLAAVWLVAILIFCLCFHDIFFTMNFETFLFWWGGGFLGRDSINK